MEKSVRDSRSSKMTGYEAALVGPVHLIREQAGLIQIQGADRVDFLQRQTTNDLLRLSPAEAVVTVLTSPKARILDVLTLVLEEEHLMALTLPGRVSATAAFLKSRVFFMDKVTVAEAGDAFIQLHLEGPGIPEIIKEVGFATNSPGGSVERLVLDEGPCWAISREGLIAPGATMVFPAASGGRVSALLEGLGCPPISAEEYDILRVEAGKPGPQRELTGEFTPLEVGLEGTVASNKGCYTGQEVLARQLTYDKVTQQMVGLRLPSPVRPGDRITVDGRQAGIVTSSAVSPRIGPIALAVIRRPFHETGREVEVGEGLIAAEVSDLPFNR